MLYIVSKTFYRANFKDKATTATVYGHHFAVKFQRPALENFCYVYKLPRFALLIWFVHKFQNANCFFLISHLKLSMFQPCSYFLG